MSLRISINKFRPYLEPQKNAPVPRRDIVDGVNKFWAISIQVSDNSLLANVITFMLSAF